MSETLIQRSPTEAIKLPNKNCPYCGVLLSQDSTTDDHVVGKRFVPKNTLSGQWNIILRACFDCNNRKSDLEDDISANTMQPSVSGDFASEDKRLASEALRKAQGSFSRETGRLVVDSSEQLEFSGEFPPGVTFTVKMSAPPQANPERLYRLACFHIQAIFFLITFNSVNQCGGFIPGIFKPLMAVNRSDWGNVVMRAFTSQLQSWNPRFAGIAAREFFKATVRRHPEGKQVWAWALEMEPELSRYRVLRKRR
ncbi:MAG TPA: HNH endonuclease signature motif containing protein [Candidatus Binataceae bacterium]|jgi:hypothetical protein|nr:HNH endonuclease signature motif containing protein [Candidatus Binataceae bacterium]